MLILDLAQSQSLAVICINFHLQFLQLALGDVTGTDQLHFHGYMALFKGFKVCLKHKRQRIIIGLFTGPGVLINDRYLLKCDCWMKHADMGLRSECHL